MSDITVTDIDRNTYSELLDSCPHSAFHKLSLLDAVVKAFALQLRLLGYFDGDNLLAVTPLMGRRMGPVMIWGAPLRKCTMPAATPFCSPSRLAGTLLPVLHQWVKAQRLRYVQVTAPEASIQAVARAWPCDPLDNLELDLDRPLAEVWGSLSQLPRRCVRKAVRAGGRVHWRTHLDMLDDQRQLVHDTYAKQGLRPNVPERLYRELLDHRTATGLRVLSATYQGQTVSAIWAFMDDEKCYYWDAASLQVARKLNANHLLVWCLIRWAHRNEYKTLDFVGTSQGGSGGGRPGIGRFKQSMGATPENYRIVYWYSDPMRLALAGYRSAHRLKAWLRARTRGIRGKSD